MLLHIIRKYCILQYVTWFIDNMSSFRPKKMSINLLSIKCKTAFNVIHGLSSFYSNSFFAKKCHLNCQRNIAGPGMEWAKGHGWARRCPLQCHMQEVSARAGNVLPLWRQRGHLATSPRADPATRDGAQPASSHAIQLWDPGGQQRFQQEPLYASVFYCKHHHESGW